MKYFDKLKQILNIMKFDFNNILFELNIRKTYKKSLLLKKNWNLLIL